MLNHLHKLGVEVRTVLSDNARQYHSAVFQNYLVERGVNARFITPYNARSNPVERVMRDLGERLRIRINDPSGKHTDHTKCVSEVDHVATVLNFNPKEHGYTPAEVLGIATPNLLHSVGISQKVIPVSTKIAQEITKLVINPKSYAPTFKKPPTSTNFTYDNEGYTHV